MTQWNAGNAIINGFLSKRVEKYMENWLTFDTLYEHSESMVSVYPNPFSGELHLNFDVAACGATEIAIYDMLGRKVFAMPLQPDKANPIITFNPHLNAGVYVLRIGKLTQKIVKY